MPGAKQPVDWGVFPLMGEDALYVRWNGGGGFGDPVSRPVENVQEDVAGGLVSTAFARDVYGVVLDQTGREVDTPATEQRRAEIIALRTANGERRSSAAV